MAIYDLESLLTPLSPEAPSGENLEYDAAFLALERSAAVKSERGIGDSVKEAEEPDWPLVADAALDLLARTRDLRVAVHLATAWTHTGGLSGWSAGLGLIHGLLEYQWDTVHPQLDADDHLDPTLRINSVAPLGDPLGLLACVRRLPLAQSPRLGHFCLRDLRIANGSLKPALSGEAGEGPRSVAEIDALCRDCAPEQLVENAAAAARAWEYAVGIEAAFRQRIGLAGPALQALLIDAGELKTCLEQRLALRMHEAAGSADASAGAAVRAIATTAADGAIRTSQDVLRCLDELCSYYAHNEPSSPIPLLLRRARKLVGKDFLELLSELAPGSIGELQAVTGRDDKNE